MIKWDLTHLTHLNDSEKTRLQQEFEALLRQARDLFDTGQILLENSHFHRSLPFIQQSIECTLRGCGILLGQSSPDFDQQTMGSRVISSGVMTVKGWNAVQSLGKLTDTDSNRISFLKWVDQYARVIAEWENQVEQWHKTSKATEVQRHSTTVRFKRKLLVLTGMVPAILLFSCVVIWLCWYYAPSRSYMETTRIVWGNTHVYSPSQSIEIVANGKIQEIYFKRMKNDSIQQFQLYPASRKVSYILISAISTTSENADQTQSNSLTLNPEQWVCQHCKISHHQEGLMVTPEDNEFSMLSPVLEQAALNGISVKMLIVDRLPFVDWLQKGNYQESLL
ncbi:MAG: hypothetical protein HQM11_16060 [SAR324 cluster bacterium]|nr:hypothetical protein [SAR324 cluster bacterium]